MPIITKPASIQKGVASSFSLDKATLAAVASVAADSYYSNQSNWQRVSLYYSSSSAGVGAQVEVVIFDATQSSPTANFLASSTARTQYNIAQIVIRDFDNGCFVVPRSQLTTSEFDITLSSGSGSTTTITYEIANAFSVSPALNPTGFIMDALGHNAISTDSIGSMTAGSASYSITFELINIAESLDPTTYISMGLGESASNTSPGIYVEASASGLQLVQDGVNIGAVFGPTPPPSGAFSMTVKMQQSGTNQLTIYVNGILYATRTVSKTQSLYPIINCFGVRAFTLTQSYTE
jgi:hypothetical protein